MAIDSFSRRYFVDQARNNFNMYCKAERARLRAIKLAAAGAINNLRPGGNGESDGAASVSRRSIQTMRRREIALIRNE